MTKPTARTNAAALRREIQTLKSENAALRADPFGIRRTPPETPERVAVFRKIAKMACEFTKRNPEFEEHLALHDLVTESFELMQNERYPSRMTLKRDKGGAP